MPEKRAGEKQSPALKGVGEACCRMEAVMEKYAHLGAQDTEPRAVLGALLRRAFDPAAPDGIADVPGTVDGWELFDEPRAKYAAVRLQVACRQLLSSIRRVPLNEVRAAKQLVERRFYFWIL